MKSLPALFVALLAQALVLTGVMVACDDIGSSRRNAPEAALSGQRLERSRIVWSDRGRKSAVVSAGELIRLDNRNEITLRDSVVVEVYDETGALVAIARGEKGTVDERSETARVTTGISVRFSGNDGKETSTLTARQAEADNRAQTVSASGNVRVHSDAGVTVYTEKVIWDGRTRRFRAPGFVRLVNGTDVEEGENLDANSDLTHWTMDRVRGRSTRVREELESGS